MIVQNLSAHWNYPGALRNYQCLCSTPRECGLIKKKKKTLEEPQVIYVQMNLGTSTLVTSFNNSSVLKYFGEKISDGGKKPHF